jgi:predicted HD phosphohydrolase
MAGPMLGYPVDRFHHSLQSATRALRNGEADEMALEDFEPLVREVFSRDSRYPLPSMNLA